ncbi:MAG TPA: hypothetical protein VFO36_03295, partial [Nitrospiraceae bacterium]|nr:hypothetical protein [Nitrospiraceae bacterium]
MPRWTGSAYVRQRTENLIATAQSHGYYMSCRLGRLFTPTERIAMSSSSVLGNVFSRSNVNAPVRKAGALLVGMSILATLGACSTVSALTKERVAQSEASFQQAEQTVGRSE